jgi:hypothetical protein
MKISDVIRNISDMVDSTPTERSSGDNTSKFTAFTGDLTLVELPDGEDEKRREPGTMPSGNDAMPEDLYLPPLQLKSELLKKAVDVENVFDDGTPAVRYDEEYGDEGWHGDDNDHSYIGAPQTAEEVDGQPDPNETTDGSDSGKRSKPRVDSDDSDDDDSDDDEERERADESLNRLLQLAMVREADQHWNRDMYDADRSSKKDGVGSIVNRRKSAIAEWDDCNEGTTDWEVYDRSSGKVLHRFKSDDTHRSPAAWKKAQEWCASKGIKGDKMSKLSCRKAESIKEWDDYDYEDDEVARGDRELARMKQFVNPANFDADDSFTVSIDDEEEQLDELSKGTLGSYVKKASHGNDLYSDDTSMRGITKAKSNLPNRLTATSKEKAHYGGEEGFDAVHDRVDRLQKNRKQGIDRAVDRLTRESDEQLSEEAKEMNRMRELAGLNPAVLFALGDDDYPV